MALGMRFLAATVLVALFGFSGAAGAQEEPSVSHEPGRNDGLCIPRLYANRRGPCRAGWPGLGGFQRLVRGHLGIQYRFRSGR